MRCPAAVPGLALCLGIPSGIFLQIHLPPLVLALSWTAALVSFVARRDRATTAFLIAGFVLAGISLGRLADEGCRTPLDQFFEQRVAEGEHQIFLTVEGRLRADASTGPSGVTLSVLVERLEIGGTWYAVPGGALVSVGGIPNADQILQWTGGRRVAFPATLRRPTRYLDPGVENAERRLAWRGTTLVGSVKSGRLVELRAAGSAVEELAASTRAFVRRAVADHVAQWSVQSAAIVTAILIGDRAGLSDEVERRLQEAGTYHVIAISGGNVAILAGIVFGILRLIRLGPRVSAVIVIAVLAAYASVVEGGSSVRRATLMAGTYLAARYWDQTALHFNVLAIVAIALLCDDPLQATEPGFVLTFGATLGILIGMSTVQESHLARRWLQVPVAIVVATVSAEAVLLPVGALLFSRVTFAGLAVNLVAIPLMTFIQIAGLVIVVASGFAAGFAHWAGWLAHLGVEGLVGSAALVDWLPWLTRRLAPPPQAVAAAYYCSFALVLMAPFIQSRHWINIRRASGIAMSGFAVLIVTTPFPVAGAADGRLRVTFLDVGQGDAALIQFPNGRTLSIDAGGLSGSSFDIGARVVSPAFWALGVRRLDYMSVTHGDIDHIGGTASVFRDFKPSEVWEGVPVPPHAPTQALRSLATAENSVWRTLQAGDRAMFGTATLIVHHPPAPDWERQRVRNDDSEVIEIRFGGVSFVFTGDISREVERALVPSFDRARLRILKVPHHGSLTSSSSAFVHALRPDVAVFSAGRGNPFGHPAAAIVDRFRQIGAAIYRTDLDGATMIETDGTTVRVKTFNGRRLTLSTHGR